jgi:hypothetical protein
VDAVYAFMEFLVNREVLSPDLLKRKLGIEAEKQSAQMTYKGFMGYMPMVGHLAENGLIVGDEFRPGNESPGAENLEFIKYYKRQLPRASGSKR